MVVRLPLLLLLVALAGAAPGATANADTAAVIDPALAWEHVAAAREAAARDQHEAAARTYLDALARDARLVPMVAHELAYQNLWREDAEKAIFYFRRYLARHPGRRDRDVRRGLALAYSWSGRQGQAIAMYRDLVAEDPTDAGSRLGLGRSLIWDNRLHEGARVLRDLESDPTVDIAGRREATRFLLTVLDQYDPTADLRWDAIRDSDDLAIDRVTGKGRTHLGRVLIEAQAGHAWYAQPGRAGIAAPRAGLGLVASLAHDWQIHAYGWVDDFSGDGSDGSAVASMGWTFVGADAWLTWLATNRLRLDLGAGRQALESLDALSRELRLDLVSLSADWRVARAWTASAVVQHGSISDDNERQRGSARLSWRREGRLELQVGPSFTYMDHRTAYPGGYWAPGWVRNVGLEGRAARRWDRLAVRVQAGVGQETEQGADTITVGNVSGHVGWRFDGRWLLGLDAGHSRSRFATASGYDRTLVSVNLRALF